MKIIAKTSERTYLIEAHENEIARITGHHSIGKESPGAQDMGSTGYGNRSYAYPIGTVFEVSPMWDWTTKAREQFAKITSTSKMLHSVAEILENAPPAALVEPAKEP